MIYNHVFIHIQRLPIAIEPASFHLTHYLLFVFKEEILILFYFFRTLSKFSDTCVNGIFLKEYRSIPLFKENGRILLSKWTVKDNNDKKITC